MNARKIVQYVFTMILALGFVLSAGLSNLSTVEAKSKDKKERRWDRDRDRDDDDDRGRRRWRDRDRDRDQRRIRFDDDWGRRGNRSRWDRCDTRNRRY